MMNLPVYVLGHLTFMLLMIGLIITGIIKAHRKREHWLKKHRGFVISGVISGLTGFGIMAITKQMKAFPHFVSNHSKLGLIALIFAVLTPVFGFMIMKQILKQRMAHRIFGIITWLCCVTAAGFGIMKVFF